MDDRHVHCERDMGRCLGDRLEDCDFLLFAECDHDHDDVFDHQHVELHGCQHDEHEHDELHDVDDSDRHHLDRS